MCPPASPTLPIFANTTLDTLPNTFFIDYIYYDYVLSFNAR